MPRKIEVSHRTIVFTVLFLLLMWFLYTIRDIILQLFVAILIMTILNPMVSRLSKLRVPRAISVLISYIIVFAIFGVAVAGIVPALIEQTSSFAANLPFYIESLGVERLISQEVANQVFSQLGNIPSQVVRFVFSLFSNILAVVTVLIFAFYLLLSREKLDDQLGSFFGEEKQKQFSRIIDLMETRLGGWARGELTLMVIIGLATYIGLSLLGIPYALSLAILAGLFEIVPYLGPIVAAVPAVIIGFGISPITGLATAALAFLIQQLEGYILVPKIMEKSIGVTPVITLLALAIGFRLAGIVGAVISVPAVITLQIFSKEYIFKT